MSLKLFVVQNESLLYCCLVESFIIEKQNVPVQICGISVIEHRDSTRANIKTKTIRSHYNKQFLHVKDAGANSVRYQTLI